VDWSDLRRREFPVAEHWAYLDHAAVSPLPRRSADMIKQWSDDVLHHGVVHWPEWEKKLEARRRDLATLIKADAEEIAYVNSTTQGISLVAEGFPWTEGDNVVTAADEYPSNIYPWQNLASRGVGLRLVPARVGRIWLEDLAAAMDARTRVLTISHVEFATGFRNDLNALCELCHGRGVALFVDAIQGLGPFVYDVRKTPIDFLCADGHKWLLGPEGAGLLYVRRDWIERLRPIGVGWHSVTTSYNDPSNEFRLKPSATRWEGGTFAMPGIQAFGASVGLLMEVGVQRVAERILDRAERVREVAQRAGWRLHGSQHPQDVSSIVVLEHPSRDPGAVVRAGRQRGVAIAARRGRLRISPHMYNDDDDLRRLSELLSGAAD
jgi:selenocysteine lyase/cysteine desulfurase